MSLISYSYPYNYLDTNLDTSFYETDVSFYVERRFSITKCLYDYQYEALRKVYEVLKLYYVDLGGNKEDFFKSFYENKKDYSDLKIPSNSRYRKIAEQYFNLDNDRIPFKNLVNRVSFWMATGSGKTLVIVKLIELLKKLMDVGHIPKKYILFLTARDDLIEQFRKHVEEFNSVSKVNIFTLSLKEFDLYERNKSIFDDYVFYYRSDLISDSQGNKIIDFRSIDNKGNWYLILDEAHKGGKEESIRQIIYSVLARNGFMFNFSATFIDEIDINTCIYNYNLQKFVIDGYGKRIFVSSEAIKGFQKDTDFSETDKKKSILKALILHTFLSKVKSEMPNYYPNPLMLVLVNSVSTDDSDLEMFFKELVSIAKGEFDQELFEQARDELKNEIKDAECIFTKHRVIEKNNLLDLIEEIKYNDVLKNFFFSEKSGDIEAKVSKGKNKEIAFQHKNSDKIFALIRIGDISEWLRSKLKDFNIVQTYEDEGFFSKINESDINLLMGSRSFYEGWDSPRPNIILYINIGKQEARKFVIQSIGRGVRVEPIPNFKMRIEKYVGNTNYLNKEKANLLEFLYVFGTKAKNLEEIVNTLKSIDEYEVLDNVEKNSKVNDIKLLVPDYTYIKTIVDSQNIKFKIHNEDYGLLENYIEKVPDIVLMFRHSLDFDMVSKIRKNYKNFVETSDSIQRFSNRPNLIFDRFVSFLNTPIQDLKGIREIDDKRDIVHFRYIKVQKEYVEKIKNEVKRVKQDFKESSIKINGIDIILDAIVNHYYIPLIYCDKEIEYIKNVIKNENEAKFLKSLKKLCNEFSKKFEWYFSRIDEGLDNLYIPYYQDGFVRKFKPDFVFWLKSKTTNDYIILFVDPKGTEHTQAYRKIDGYKMIYEDKSGKPKVFSYDNLTVRVLLMLQTENLRNVPKEYKKYWFNNLNELLDVVDSICKPDEG
ncbi:MAG: DEAD/DEAH box helicase family protein [Candidatus Aenigmatarchaeota archaeon]